MSIVSILIEENTYFPCPVEWSVRDATEQIRYEYGFVNGAIRCNGTPLKSTVIIGDLKEGDVLTFVNGKKYLLFFNYILF